VNDEDCRIDTEGYRYPQGESFEPMPSRQSESRDFQEEKNLVEDLQPSKKKRVMFDVIVIAENALKLPIVKLYDLHDARSYPILS